MNKRIASANGTWHDDGAGLSIGDLGSIFSFLQENPENFCIVARRRGNAKDIAAGSKAAGRVNTG